MKYSLHIGINHYDRSAYGSNADLQQCVRDAEAMYDIAEGLRFDALLLRDGAATKAEVLRILEEYAGKCREGDVLLFTQSSHGAYADNSSGRRATGLCMHDDVLWDWEQVEVWKRFAKGVLIVRVVDCCYAESNFRNLMPTFARAKVLRVKAPALIPTAASLRKCKAGIISFASSSVEQVSWETADGGVFTVVLEQVLSQGRYGLSYRDVRNRAARTMRALAFAQTPKLELVNAARYAARAKFGERF